MTRTNDFEVRPASHDELDAVCELYASCIGRDGCTWNEYYPSREDAENDLGSGCLYVGVHDGKVIATISVVPENELDGQKFWNIDDGKTREIARIAVSRLYEGHGYAKALVSRIIDILRTENCTAVHLLVAKRNINAVRLYRSLGFEFVGECFMYGNDYYACEMKLTETPRS